MATVHDELHALIDALSEEEAAQILQQMRSAQSQKLALAEWLEEARKLREELAAKYGQFPSAVDVLHEIREERLNDLMGRE